MSYREYVIAAYAVFAVVMLWDLIAPRLQIRQQLRAAKLRSTRATTARTAPSDIPLSRE